MMMMAHTSDSPPPSLDTETIAAVRAALAGCIGEGSPTPELRTLLIRVSTEARSKGIMAERLLVLFKDIWGSLPEVRRAERSATTAHDALLQQVITRCIQQYYAE